MTPRPLIIDCDPGKDDAVALLLAFASPEFDLLAITTVAGNVGLDKTTRNALRLCEVAERFQMAVHAGCPRPILKPLDTAVRVHGEDGLAGADLPDPVMTAQSAHGVDFLVDRLMASDGEITCAALGPLTNLALAMVKQPAIIAKIREIVLMGGAIAGGNVTPYAEFNIHTDPHAAAVVFESGAPLTMIGLDVTHQAIATPERIRAIDAIGGPAAAVVSRMLALDLERREGGAPLHDPCVIAYLLAPDLFTGEAMAVTIELADGERMGQTIASGPGAVNVLKRIDADGFFALLTERLERL